MSGLVLFIVYLLSLIIFFKILKVVSKWSTLLALQMISSVPSVFAQSRVIYYSGIGLFGLLAISMAFLAQDDEVLMLLGAICVGIGFLWAISSGRKAAYQEFRSIAVFLLEQTEIDEERSSYMEMANLSDSELRSRVKQYKEFEKLAS